MTLLDRIRGTISQFAPDGPIGISPVTQAQVSEQPPDWFGGIPSYLWPTIWPGDPEELQFIHAATRNPMVFACITRIASDLAALPLKWTTSGTQGRRKPLPDSHWIVQLFEYGNAQYSGFEVRRDMQAGLDNVGNSLMWGEREDRTGPPIGLWHVPAHLTRPILGPKRSIREFFYWPEAKTYDATDMTPFRYWNPNWNPLLPAPWGMSPLSAARYAFESRDRQGQWQKGFYTRGAQVAGLYTLDPETAQGLQTSEIKAMQEKMLAIGGGPENVNKPIITPGLKLVRPPLMPKDTQFLEMLLQNDMDVLRVFHMPPLIMGIKEGGGLSDAGAKADLLLYAMLCLFERKALFEKVVSNNFCRQWGLPDVRVEIDLTGHFGVTEAMLAQAEALVKISGSPVMTLNQARRVRGDDPADDPFADKYLADFRTILREDLASDIRVEPGAPGQPSGVSKDEEKSPPKRGGGGGSQRRSVSRLRGRNRAALRRLRDRDLARYERRVARYATSRFTRQERAVIARIPSDLARVALVNGNDLLPEDLTDDDVQALYQSIMADRAESAASEVAAELDVEVFLQKVQSRIERHAAEFVTNIDATTRGRLVDAIETAVADRASYSDLVRAVRDVFDGRRANAETIARTETAWAYNLASQQTWADAGIRYKSWLTAEDDRVRDSHTACEDEGNIGMDEAFSNGLMYPGDPDGEADEVVNCRCVLMPEFSADSDVGHGDIGSVDDEEGADNARRNGNGVLWEA